LYKSLQDLNDTGFLQKPLLRWIHLWCGNHETDLMVNRQSGQKMLLPI